MRPYRLALLALAACSSAAVAGDVDPASLYEVSTAGTSARVKAGGKGTLVLEIKARGDAHVSEESPLSVELAGKNVRLAKEKLSRADTSVPRAPRFEVPLIGEQAGAGSVDVKATFFICTENLCARQKKQLSVPVTVE